MFLRTALCGFTGLCLLTMGCGELPAESEMQMEAQPVATTAQALTTHAQDALAWANGWISDVTSQPGQLAENVYSASSPALERIVGTAKAKNRSVCGTFVTQLLQKSLTWVPNDFYKSFNKAMDGTCDVGTAMDGTQKGTSSPGAAQYQYKIANCASTGLIKFTARSTLSAVEAGDILAVRYTERTDVTGHVMLVRSAPVQDDALPAGPTGSTAYAVEIIDSTDDPHGTSATYPDWRGGGTGQGLGTGRFILYANASGAIVASRWSATDGTMFNTSVHPVSIGGLQ